MRGVLLLAPLALAVGIVVACGGGDDEATAVDRLKCESLGAKDSYHFSSRTGFAVKDTGIAATSAPSDPTPFALSWEVDADVTGGGYAAQAKVRTDDGGGRVNKEVIEIGTDAWTTLGEGSDFVKIPGVGGAIPFPPDETCQALVAGFDLTSLTGAPEKVNGINSLKYEVAGLPSTALAAIPSIGSGADAVTVVKEYNGAIWVASDGYISKLDLSGTGEYEGGRQAIDVEMRFEYSDINGVDTEIVAPVPR